ncbi:MAG: hypothetical protein ACI9T9_001661 [Oleiphilaceae bacterium]|jgi:hypothetical protein
MVKAMITTKISSINLLKSVAGISLAFSLSSGTSAIGIEDVVDGGNDFAWERIEIPGTKCSDGSQYKFWVYDNPSSTNLVMMFEGGGACWDYESCSGRLGKLGAANPNGIADDFITSQTADFVSPIVNGADPGFPFRSKTDLATKGWDVAFMPYCTGDVHVGNKITTYTDPTGIDPPLNFHHMGYSNSTAAFDYMANRFPTISKFLITGFSAGGVASGALYHSARQQLNFNEGYMLNDSGPLFPAPDANANSRQLHDTISSAWDIPSVLVDMPTSFDPNDMGSVSHALALEYPNDHFAYTGYSTDFNFSRFSYERFFPGIDETGILNLWREDQAILVDEMNEHDNFSYHIPWNRPINDSHCSTIITFIGSHACPSVRKKKWYEFWQWPWSQDWKCPGTSTGMTDFLSSWINDNNTIRLIEPYNLYNQDDPGMQIIGPQIDGAI